jgi:hypothetical protein
MLILTSDWRGMRALLAGNSERALARAARKAGSTGLREMRSEASKRVRQRKRIKAGMVGRALHARRPKGGKLNAMVWAVDVRGDKVPLSAYPHRQVKRGVSVEVNRGKRTILKSAFVASAGSGHKGVWLRRGKERLPIRELLGSRPVDALLHKGEADAVQQRGARAFRATFLRVLPLELGK